MTLKNIGLPQLKIARAAPAKSNDIEGFFPQNNMLQDISTVRKVWLPIILYWRAPFFLSLKFHISEHYLFMAFTVVML